MRKYLLYILLLLHGFTFAQQRIKISGKVIDAQQKPLEFATVTILETNEVAFTDATGNFRFLQVRIPESGINIRLSMVGKQSKTLSLTINDLKQDQIVILNDLSLSLTEVNVTAQRKRSDISNSSILFDRQAIEQVQAYSLADVLNNLPGKATVAPDLQYRQNITLRTAASDDNRQAANNSMGVAIYVDGIRQSNDANMQNKNVGLWGLGGATVINHKDPGKTGNPSYDTPFTGLDIRNIPADNIESIEVVSGVASARYGELTDGAIIINRMAGKTDYLANIRLNGSSTNVSLSKGFLLNKKAGAVNVNFNYLNSIQDPTNDLKKYGRVSAGLMWTTFLHPKIKNTFSADFSSKNDHYSADPDDGTEESMFSKERKLSISNRTSFTVEKKWLRTATLALSYDVGYQETYRQLYVNSAPLGIADKDTTGIYEGYFIPGNFLSVDHIVGKPYNGSANLDLLTVLQTGKVTHEISYGASAYFSGNRGSGVQADPTHPFTNTPSGSYKSERPYDFDLLHNIVNVGWYAEDRLKFKVWQHQFNIAAGARYDLQNNFPNFQPRINASYQLNKRWSLRAAFGVATKAPSMSYRYPGPTYFDVPLLNVYNGKAAESLYLVYTQKTVHDNSELKPSRSTQTELGASADYGFFNTSIYGYYKRNRDGFGNAANYLPIYLPVYSYTLNPGSKPTYQATGETKLYSSLQDNYVANNVSSDNTGIEWLVSTRKIRAIQTTFNLSTSLSYTHYQNTGYYIAKVSDSYIYQGAVAWYGIYPGTNYKNLAIMSKISSDTHIPKLGFVVSVIADVFWKNTKRYLGQTNYPVAYIDKDGTTVPIENFDPNNKDYGYLLLRPDNATYLQDPPFVYANLSLRVAKEIRKKIRVSLYAYNFLDIRTRYYNPVLNSLTTYSSPVNVGGEISFKF